MDDIVTRLRYKLPFNLTGLTTEDVQNKYAEAADEIERLQSYIRVLEAEIEAYEKRYGRA